jgi:hypothetical protein
MKYLRSRQTNQNSEPHRNTEEAHAIHKIETLQDESEQTQTKHSYQIQQLQISNWNVKISNPGDFSE